MTNELLIIAINDAITYLDVIAEPRGEDCCDDDRLAGADDGGGNPAFITHAPRGKAMYSMTLALVYT